MRKITQTIVGTTPPLDKNVVWLDSTDSTAPVEKVFINGQWTPMGVDTDDYYTKDEIDDKLDEKLDVIENPVNGNLIAMNSQGQATNSGKKIVDFIANPEVAGQNGEVLSVDSEGNPVWTTVTPTGTADTEMSDSSTNAVQNKVIKSYVDDNYAKKDGYYSQMTVGSAENLISQTVDKDAYLIRPTATSDDATNEVANGVASVLGMEGNSCVWNQMVKNGDFSGGNLNWTTNDATLSINDNKALVQSTSSNGGIFQIVDTKITHKIFIHYSVLNISGSWRCGLFKGYGANPFYAAGQTDTITQTGTYQSIITVGEIGAPSTFYCMGFGRGSQNSTILLDNIYVIDLTLLGIDNLTTTAKVEEWLAQHVGTKPYYAYNTGTILSAQTLGIKTYGQNLLNPTTKQAKLIPYTWEDNSNIYTIKNVLSGATATFTPDATGVAESITITDNEFDITSYGSGILELSAATADTYVCMKWDEQKDDDVVPYEDHTYDFDVRKVYGKVSGAGEYVQCYPNGMRGAGSVHDSLTASKAVVNVGSIDLGNLEVGITLQEHVFEASISEKQLISGAGTSDLVCSNYSVVERKTYFNMSSYGIDSICELKTNSLDNKILIYNGFKTTAPTSEDNWVDGVMLNYVLATPITYTDLIYRDGGIDRPLADVLMNIEVNNWSMEEQLMTPYVDGNPTSIPATISTIYGMDAVEQIDTLNKTCYFAKDVKDNLQALLTCINTNCAETLGGTFSIGDPTQEDSKVFTFTFTENTEPDVEPTNEGE